MYVCVCAGTSTIVAELAIGAKRYITGAPRSQDVGQVFIYRLDTSLGDVGLVLEQTLTGEQFGSWFGGDLTVLDLNGDG